MSNKDAILKILEFKERFLGKSVKDDDLVNFRWEFESKSTHTNFWTESNDRDEVDTGFVKPRKRFTMFFEIPDEPKSENIGVIEIHIVNTIVSSIKVSWENKNEERIIRNTI